MAPEEVVRRCWLLRERFLQALVAGCDIFETALETLDMVAAVQAVDEDVSPRAAAAARLLKNTGI